MYNTTVTFSSGCIVQFFAPTLKRALKQAIGMTYSYLRDPYGSHKYYYDEITSFEHKTYISPYRSSYREFYRKYCAG